MRNLTGDAALLEVGASDKLLLDSGTARRPGRATVTRRKLCGGVCGLGGGPREVTSQTEQYVTFCPNYSCNEPHTVLHVSDLHAEYYMYYCVIT